MLAHEGSLGALLLDVLAYETQIPTTLFSMAQGRAAYLESLAWTRRVLGARVKLGQGQTELFDTRSRRRAGMPGHRALLCVSMVRVVKSHWRPKSPSSTAPESERAQATRARRWLWAYELAASSPATGSTR